MQVELHTTGGQTITACWGDAFGHFGLELIEALAGEIFDNEPEQRDFSRHRWWQPFMASSVHAALLWRSGSFESGLPAPVALKLSVTNARLWVAAAIPFDGASHMARGGLLLAMDHVLVTADATFAASIGLVA